VARRSITEVMSANISSASGEPETAISIEKVPEKFFEPPAAAVTLERPPDEGENGLARSPSEAPYSIFSKDTKIFIVFMACIAGLISPLAATMYYPALNPLAEALHVSNSKITLSITTYMVTLMSKMIVDMKLTEVRFFKHSLQPSSLLCPIMLGVALRL